MGHSGTDGAKVQVHSVEVVDQQGWLVAGIILIIILYYEFHYHNQGFLFRRAGRQRRHVLLLQNVFSLQESWATA